MTMGNGYLKIPQHTILHLPPSEGVLTTLALLRWILTFLTLLFVIRTYQSYQNQQQHRWDSLSPNTNPCHNTNINSTIQAKPKQILSKSVILSTRPTSTQQFRQGRVRELALSCGILDLKNMQRDKLTSDPKYFETCLTSLYSYITYHTDKHKPFTQILLTNTRTNPSVLSQVPKTTFKT